MASSIWATSSRVGARMSARGRRGRGARAARGEAGEQRQQEGDRLAGAGAAAAEHVAAREGVGQRRGLDGGGGRDRRRRRARRRGGRARRACRRCGMDKSVPSGFVGSSRTVVVGVDVGCSAGRALGRGAAPGAVSRREASTSKKCGPRQKAGRYDQSTGHRCQPRHRGRRSASHAAEDPRDGRAYSDVCRRCRSSRSAPSCCPVRGSRCSCSSPLPRAGPQPSPSVTTDDRLLRRAAHPQGPRGRAGRGAGPARDRLRGTGRRDGARRGRHRHRRSTWSPPACAGSASTASTTAPAPRSPPASSPGCAEPPAADDPEVPVLAERALREHAAYLDGPRRGGRARRGAARPGGLPGRRADGARPVATASGCSRARTPPTRLRTVHRAAAPRGGHRRTLRGAADPARPGRGLAQLTTSEGPGSRVGCRAWTSRTCRTSSSAPTASATGSAACPARSRGSPRRSASWRRRCARAATPSASTSSPTSSPGSRRSPTRWASTSRGGAAVRRGVPPVRGGALHLPLTAAGRHETSRDQLTPNVSMSATPPVRLPRGGPRSTVGGIAGPYDGATSRRPSPTPWRRCLVVRAARSAAWPSAASPGLARWGVRSWLLLGVLAFAGAVLWLLSQVSGFVVPLVLAVVLGALFAPLVERLRARGCRARAARCWCCSGSPPSWSARSGWSSPAWPAVRPDRARSSPRAWTRSDSWLASHGVDIGSGAARPPTRSPSAAGEALGGLVAALSGTFSSLVALGIGTAIGAFLVYYVIVDWDGLTGWVGAHLGLDAETGAAVVGDSAVAVRRYFWALTLSAVVTAVLIGGAAWLLGVPLAFTIGVVTLVTSYVPYLGAIVSGAFATLIALGSNGLEHGDRHPRRDPRRAEHRADHRAGAASRAPRSACTPSSCSAPRSSAPRWPACSGRRSPHRPSPWRSWYSAGCPWPGVSPASTASRNRSPRPDDTRKSAHRRRSATPRAARRGYWAGT